MLRRCVILRANLHPGLHRYQHLHGRILDTAQVCCLAQLLPRPVLVPVQGWGLQADVSKCYVTLHVRHRCCARGVVFAIIVLDLFSAGLQACKFDPR